MLWLLTFIDRNSSFILVVISVVVFISAFLIMGFRYPYQSAKKHGFTIAGIVFIIAIIYGVEKYAHFGELQSWIGIADNMLSGSIFAIFCFLFWRVERKIKNRFEDAEKLCQDYDALSQKYSQDNLVVAINQDGHKVTYPVIDLGTGCILLVNAGNQQIHIVDSPDDYYQLPTILEKHYLNIFSIHDTSNTYNSLNIRVKSMLLKDNRLELVTMRTTYYDSLVTNRAPDYSFSEGLSVRELFAVGPKMTPLEKSRLSNHLGFNGFVESEDGYIVFVKRSNDMSIGKRTYGDSIGASLKTQYALDGDGQFTCQKLREAIIKEINDELKIDEEGIQLNTLSIIAAYRDCVECGKPQLLIYAKSYRKASDISMNFTKLRRKELSETKKLNKRQRQELKTLVDGTKLLWLRKDSLVKDIIYYHDRIEIENVPEKGFVTFNGRGKRPSAIHSLKMVPSASASVYIFKDMLLRSTNVDTNH